MILALRLAAPWLAVGVFWCVLENAWLAILAYHLQIVLWSRRFPCVTRPRRSVWMWFLLPSILAGPALYLLLPHLARVELIEWLARFQLSGWGLITMAGYFGLVHPWLEQTHWTPLRDRTPFAHLAFAGYHVLVLASLLSPIGCALCFVALLGASWTWQRMTCSTGSILPETLSQVAADAGIVLIAIESVM